MSSIPQPPRSPLDPQRPESIAIWRRWFEDITKIISTLSGAAGISWDVLSKAGSNLADLVIRNHNDLDNIQGGSVGQRYHLTSEAATTAENAENLFLQLDQTFPQNIVNGPPVFDALDFNQAPVSPSGVTGRLRWNSTEGTLDLGQPNDVTQQIGQETFFYIKNQTGATLTNGKPIMFAGAVGASGRLKGQYAIANGTIPAQYIMGIATQDIADGADGYVTNFGKVRAIDTSGTPYGEVWADGDVLYVSPTTPGGLTKTAPNAPNLQILVAAVVYAHAQVGTLFVRPTFASKLTDLDDVNGTPLSTTGQFPVWNNTAGYFDFNYNITNYFYKPGLAGGQTAYGGSAASENLTLGSTAHATKGRILTDAQTITSSDAAVIGEIVKGAAAQTANLQEWQDSASAVKSSKSATGVDTSLNYVSTATTGTQPYACTSTTLNTNHNSDLLDSQHGTYYLTHSNQTGLTNDDHTQYALLVGRAGGQSLVGGAAAGENLTIGSTAHATKGKILFGTSAYDESKQSLLIGTNTYTFGASNNPVMVTHSSIAPGGGLSALYNRPDSTKQLFVGFLRGGDPLNQDFFIGSPATTTNQFCVGTGTGASISATMCAHKTTGFSFGDYGAIVTLTPPAWLSIIIPSASIKGQIIQAAASQTANLTEWQNSSAAVLSSVSATGVNTAPNYISTVATGTQSYAGTSTTLNTNLNSDLLDSQHGTYYLDRTNHTGIVTNYNGIATEGYGHPAIVDLVALTAQTADIASTNFTNAGAAGLYRVNYYLETTTADVTAGDITLTVSFTDGAGATSVSSTALILTAVGRTSGVFFVRLASGNISYAVTHTGIFGTSAYALHAICERVN